MKNILAVAAAATGLLMTSPALAALPVGAVAPTFKTTAALAGAQTQFDLAAALKKGPVVLYFFPAAFTPGCTAEANEFAEATADFNAAGATIIGMTGGNVDRIAEFSKVECRDKFAVGATTPAMIKAYDVALAVRPGWTSRVSYVIGQDGKIAFVHNAGDFRGHVSGTLAAVRKLKK